MDAVELHAIEGGTRGGDLAQANEQGGGETLLDHDTLLFHHATRRLSLHTQSAPLRDQAIAAEG